MEDGRVNILKGEGSSESDWNDTLGGQAVGVAIWLTGFKGPGRIQLGRAVPIK